MSADKSTDEAETDETQLLPKTKHKKSPLVGTTLFESDYVPIVLYSCICSVTWMTPLAGSRVVENAFVTGYRGVNISSVYLRSAVVCLCAFPIAALFKTQSSKVIFSMVCAIIGIVLMIIGCFAGQFSGPWLTPYFYAA